MNKHQCLMGKIPTTRNMREKKSQTEIFQRFSDWNEDGKLAADFISFFHFYSTFCYVLSIPNLIN